MSPVAHTKKTLREVEVHALVVVFVVVASTIYAVLAHDHSSNVWIVYGSAVAYAAGRSGAPVAMNRNSRGSADV